MKKILTWFPRIIAIVYGVVFAFLAFYAFGRDASFGKQFLSFLGHLTPAFLVGLFLCISWKYKILGGLLFIILGQMFTIYFGTHHHLSTFFLVSIPLFVAGALFILSHWNLKKE